MTTLTTRVFGSAPHARCGLERAPGTRASRPRAPSAVMLSGGNTPLPAYRALAQQPPRHDERLHVLFSDERYVPGRFPDEQLPPVAPLLEALGLPEEATAARAHRAAARGGRDALRERTHHTPELGRPHRPWTPRARRRRPYRLALQRADLERARGRYALPVQRPDGMAAVSVTPESARHRARAGVRRGRCRQGGGGARAPARRIPNSSPGARCRAARSRTVAIRG